MRAPGEQLTSQILQDLACPQCEYNLRGLAGDIVHCPECGLECNIPQMIARKWIGPWHQAPGFTRLLMPLAWLSFMLMFVFPCFMVEVTVRRGNGLVTSIGAAIMILGWLVLLRRAEQVLEEHRGALLALLAHLLFAGYIVSLTGIIMMIVVLLSRQTIVNLLFALVIVPAMIGLFVLCRRGERYIAEQCIKNYLLQRIAPPVPCVEID